MGDSVYEVNQYIEEGDEEELGNFGAPSVGLPGPAITNWAALGVKPPPLRPLKYCDMRVEEGMCLRYASLELDTMSFCTFHHQEVTMALAEEEKRIS